jgi:hypothetical protein
LAHTKPTLQDLPTPEKSRKVETDLKFLKHSKENCQDSTALSFFKFVLVVETFFFFVIIFFNKCFSVLGAQAMGTA